jgi:hypothetical protein
MGLAESIQQGFETAQIARMRSLARLMLKSLNRHIDTLLDQRKKLCEVIDNCDAQLRPAPTLDQAMADIGAVTPADVPHEMDHYEPN